MKILTPSVGRTAVSLLVFLLLFTACDYFWDGYHEHKWWSAEYIASLAIPFTIAPIAVWFMFVPKQLAYSETEFMFERRFSANCQLPWSELEYYGPGDGVLMVQFKGRRVIQIFGAAFRSSEWKEFVDFLSDNFPDKKASGELFGKMFKWPK